MFKLINVAGLKRISASQIFGIDDKRMEIGLRNVQWAKDFVASGRASAMLTATTAEKQEDTFGQKLCHAVQRRLASQRRHIASSSDEESFGQKLARAAKAQAASRCPCYLRR